MKQLLITIATFISSLFGGHQTPTPTPVLTYSPIPVITVAPSPSVIPKIDAVLPKQKPFDPHNYKYKGTAPVCQATDITCSQSALDNFVEQNAVNGTIPTIDPSKVSMDRYAQSYLDLIAKKEGGQLTAPPSGNVYEMLRTLEVQTGTAVLPEVIPSQSPIISDTITPM